MYRGKFAFQNDWASLMVGRKFTIFCFVLLCKVKGNFLYLERRFNGGSFALSVWGAYIWRGSYVGWGGGDLFSELYGMCKQT